MVEFKNQKVDVLVDWRGHKAGDSFTCSTPQELAGALAHVESGIFRVEGVTSPRAKKSKPQATKTETPVAKPPVATPDATPPTRTSKSE
jgi:hypothetical protein